MTTALDIEYPARVGFVVVFITAEICNSAVAEGARLRRVSSGHGPALAVCIGKVAAISNSPDDLTVVEGLRAGDRAVTERFVRDNAGWMKALARGLLRDDSGAEDCVQEALINAIRQIESFEKRSSLKTWLHRITVNSALMRLRKAKRLAETPIDDLMPEFDANSCRIEAPWARLAAPQEILEQSRLRDLVRETINQLPDSYRVVMQLRDIEEMTTLQVAELLGLSEANVKVRLHRARSALKKLLEPILRGEAL